MIFECNYLTCRNQLLNNCALYWKKIDKIEYLYFIKNNNINWKKTSWYAWRGFNVYWYKKLDI